MSQAPKTRRRWFRFSLAMMFAAVTLFSMALAWIGYEWRTAQKRLSMKAWIDGNGGHAYTISECNQMFGSNFPNRLGFVRHWLGDEEIGMLQMAGGTEEQIDQAFATFPEIPRSGPKIGTPYIDWSAIEARVHESSKQDVDP